MAARRRPGLSLLGGCTQGGQLVWQPCYPCAALVWSLHLNIVRIRRRRPANADWSADASKKPVVVRRFGHANPFWAFKVRGEGAGAVVPNTRARDASPRAPPRPTSFAK